jgi:hypothetical protein
VRKIDKNLVNRKAKRPENRAQVSKVLEEKSQLTSKSWRETGNEQKRTNLEMRSVKSDFFYCG